MHFELINLFVLIICAGIYLVVIRALKLDREFPKIDSSYLTKKTTERVVFFDFIKGLAILAVIFIHVAFFIRFLSEDLSLSSLEWNEHINRITRFAIPLFLISSGALLSLPDLQKKSLKNFYLPKLKRIFIPYVFFSFFASYIFFGATNDFLEYFFRATNDFLIGRASPAFWFISVLFQLYLLYPFLWYGFVVKKIKPATMLLASLLFSFFSYFFLSSQWLKWLVPPEGFTFFGGYLFFFVLGMVLKPIFLTKKQEMIKWLNKINFPCWAVFVFTAYLFIGALQPLERYYNIRLIYGPTVMLLLFYLFPLLKQEKIKIFLEKIGKRSLYFYLIHFIILHYLFLFVKMFNLYDLPFPVLFSGMVVFGFFISYFFIVVGEKLFNLFSISKNK